MLGSIINTGLGSVRQKSSVLPYPSISSKHLNWVNHKFKFDVVIDLLSRDPIHRGLALDVPVVIQILDQQIVGRKPEMLGDDIITTD